MSKRDWTILERIQTELEAMSLVLKEKSRLRSNS
jgi:hypothetical protein